MPGRGRSLSPRDAQARRNSPYRDASPAPGHEPCPAIEELCTCGLHISPKKLKQRRPLPFDGQSSAREDFRLFDDGERANAYRDIMNKDPMSKDFPFRGLTGPTDLSSYRADYLKWELDRSKPNITAKMRRPLPFDGTSEQRDKHRMFDEGERRSALRQPMGMGSGNKPWADQDNDPYQSTSRLAYTRHPLEPAPPAKPTRGRKPLPFDGTSESRDRLRSYSPDERTNALRDPINRDAHGTSLWDELGITETSTQRADYTPKELEKSGKAPAQKMRKPLPFDGDSTQRSDYLRWEDYEKRGLIESAKRATPNLLGDGEMGLEATYRHDYQPLPTCPVTKLLKNAKAPTELPDGRDHLFWDEVAQKWY